jgi:lactoylglutathione lyase
MVIKVASMDAARRYYGNGLQMEEVEPGAFRCGESMLFLEEEPSRAPAGGMRGPGYRYMTVQVWDCDLEFEGIVGRGGTPSSKPRTFGEVARFGFVRDPDGNGLEISQRASLTGPLPPNED